MQISFVKAKYLCRKQINLLLKWSEKDFPKNVRELGNTLESWIKNICVYSRLDPSKAVELSQEFMQHVYNHLFNEDCGNVRMCNRAMEYTIRKNSKIILKHLTEDVSVGLEFIKDFFLIFHSTNMSNLDSSMGMIKWTREIIKAKYGNDHFKNELNSGHPREWSVEGGVFWLR